MGFNGIGNLNGNKKCYNVDANLTNVSIGHYSASRHQREMIFLKMEVPVYLVGAS